MRELDALLMPVALEDAELAVAVARNIDKAVERLASFPESSPVFTEYLRRLSIPKLPYSCYYEYICGEVRIIHIRHDHQNPFQ